MTVTTEPITPAESPRNAAVPDVPIHRLTVQQYLAMGEAGILAEDEPVELLEGWLVEKVTKKPPHMVATGFLLDLIPRVLPQGWFLNMQDPITTPDSLPEPDAVVIRGSRRDYLQNRPTAADVGLIIEVADTTLRTDQGTKKRLYARVGIPVYWIVNLIEGQIEVYTDPTGDTDEPDYRHRHTFGPADEIPVVLDGTEVGRIVVRDVLP